VQSRPASWAACSDSRPSAPIGYMVSSRALEVRLERALRGKRQRLWKERMSTSSEDLGKKVQDLEKAQEVQAATQAGAQATQAATQAGQASTMAAAQAGTWTTVGAAGVALIVGIFLGLAIANSR
jgi:hypothetical protein